MSNPKPVREQIHTSQRITSPCAFVCVNAHVRTHKRQIIGSASLGLIRAMSSATIVPLCRRFRKCTTAYAVSICSSRRILLWLFVHTQKNTNTHTQTLLIKSQTHRSAWILCQHEHPTNTRQRAMRWWCSCSYLNIHFIWGVVCLCSLWVCRQRFGICVFVWTSFVPHLHKLSI